MISEQVLGSGEFSVAGFPFRRSLPRRQAKCVDSGSDMKPVHQVLVIFSRCLRLLPSLVGQ